MLFRSCPKIQIQQNLLASDISSASNKFPKFTSRFKSLQEDNSLKFPCPNQKSFDDLLLKYKNLVDEAIKDYEKNTSTKSTSKIQTITCIKGKVVKKISGLQPKCPSGYKLK